MNDAESFAEIFAVLSPGPGLFEEKIRRFSTATCRDYSLPLQLIYSFLMDAKKNPEKAKDLSRIRSHYRAEIDATKDIVASLPFSRYLTFHDETAELHFVDTVPLERRLALSRYLWSKTGGIA